MRRRAVFALLVVVPLLGLAYWIANHTYWADITVPMPLKGEAATNPFYAAQRIVDTLGGKATRDRALVAPRADAVIVLSAWNWNLSPGRRQALERWVESGGRLVVDSTVTWEGEFEAWSGIRRQLRDATELLEAAKEKALESEACLQFQEQYAGRVEREPVETRWLCDLEPVSALVSRDAPVWSLREQKAGVQVTRVRVGRGSVTAINAAPFQFRRIFDGDHGWLLVTAAQLQPGDDVHFLSEGDYPSLLALTWQNGAPVVWLGLVVVALLLWRGAIRTGPLVPAASSVRRSLAEQIRGTGRFALQHDDGGALHAATVRALNEAARRRVAGYGGLSARDRTIALASLAGVDPASLSAAIHHPHAHDANEVRGAITRLESLRRDLLNRQTRPLHGTK